MSQDFDYTAFAKYYLAHMTETEKTVISNEYSHAEFLYSDEANADHGEFQFWEVISFDELAYFFNYLSGIDMSKFDSFEEALNWIHDEERKLGLYIYQPYMGRVLTPQEYWLEESRKNAEDEFRKQAEEKLENKNFQDTSEVLAKNNVTTDDIVTLTSKNTKKAVIASASAKDISQVIEDQSIER